MGTATVTVTGRGNYTGSLTKTFSIVPKKTQFSSLSTGSMKIKASWKEQSVQTSGYQIQYCTSKSFPAAKRKTITISDPSAVSKSFGDLLDNQTYYLRIRTFKKSDGRNYYSDWSKTKSIRFRLNDIRVTGSGTTRTVNIKNVSPADSDLKMAVWSKKNGKDDLYWYPMTKQSDGSYQAELEGSRIADTGTCNIHIYSGEDTYLNAATCSFTASELKSAGGKYLVHKYAKSILKATGETLRGAYDWAVGQITYQSMVVPMTLPG